MSVVANLAPGFSSKEAKIGDAVKIEVVIDELVGAVGDRWKITDTNSKWVVSGNLVIDSGSIFSIPAESSLTKLELNGIIHSPGEASIGQLKFIHEKTLKEFSLSETTFSALSVAQKPAEEQAEPVWYMPTISIGGWNYFLIGIFSIVFLSVLSFGIYKLVLRLRRGFDIKLNHKERALKGLELLQPYGKPGKILRQEDWKKFSFDLASVLRKYTDSNFQFNSSDMTDREFLYELSRMEKAAQYVEVLRKILSTIDEVRYGKKDLDISIVPGLLVDSKQYVESTFIDHEKPETKK